MVNVVDVKRYIPKSSDKFFFDNNIWIHLNCPIGSVNYQLQKKYSLLQQSIISSKASIFVNSLVLSEFANTSLRIDFDIWRKKQATAGLHYKKDYIPTAQYKSTTKSIKSAIENILKLAVRQPDDFHIIDIDNIHRNFETIDFNDCYYIEFCKKNSLILVTEDKDFNKIHDTQLNVITLS